MNPMDLLKNFQGMQEKMGDVQGKLKHLRTDGYSGGDLIKVTVDGTMEAVSVHIDPVAVDPRDVKMLEELLTAAFTDAVRKMRDEVQKELAQMAGGLNLPPGFTGGL